MRVLRWLVLTNVTLCRLVIFINSMSLSHCSPESWLKQKQALSVAVQHARDPTGNCNFKLFFLLGCVLFQECIYLLNRYIHTTKQYGRFSIARKHWWSELCITELFKSAILKPAANIIDAAILKGAPVWKLLAERLSWMRRCFVLFPHPSDIISASPETRCVVDAQRLMENSSPPISPV